MNDQMDVHGQAEALKRSLNRAAASIGVRVDCRPIGRRTRALLRTGDQGSALVEFSLIMPVLLLLTTGLLVFGVAMNNYLQLTNAVSIGARTLAINAQMTTDPCAVASNAVIAAAPNLTASKFTFSYNLNGTVYTGTSCPSGTVSTGAAGNLAPHTSASVTATYPFNLSVYGMNYSQGGAVLSATSTELVQ
jgi:Flp pilus assembly protein TadG